MAVQERQLRAIVFCDVVDSSAKIFADELIAIQRIKEDLTLIREELQRHGGSLVKSLGDGLLVTFEAPTQALEFVQSVVQKLHSRSSRQSLAHRFGLHTGEIYTDGDDILGQGVHLASRLHTVSPPNGVAFVRSTYELIAPRFRRLASSLGALELKGLPEPIEVYCLDPDRLLHSGDVAETQGVQLATLLADTPFELVRPLGRSSQQQTLLLQERLRERQAVMKVIPASAALVEVLQVEAACLDRLRHPSIPRVLDGFARGGVYCFIQEYIPGPSLQGSLDLLRRKQRLAELLRKVLEVLEVVHAAGLAHGDIHPANLIPALQGNQLFLVDFSLMKARLEVRHPGACPGLMLPEAGRPFFSAPERARFGRLTPASDLYALGVSALTLHTGQDPAALYDEAQARWSLQGLEPEVVGWLEPLLEELPARRLPQAADALRLLDQPQGLPGASGASAGLGRGPAVSKAALHAELVTTYGPMVELLLESQPSLIPPQQLPGLQQRLVAAGLARADVQEALQRLQKAAVPSVASAVPASAPPPPAPSPPSSSVPVGDRLLPLLREAIGPIADLICTPELELASHADLRRCRQLLLQALVPEAAVDAVLQRLSDRPAAAPSVVPLPPEPAAAPPASGASASPQERNQSAAPDGEQVLLRTVGPIGSTIWARVSHLPAAERTPVVLAALQGFGLDALTLAELRRELEGG